VRNDRGGAAEVTVLSSALGVERHDGAARLTLDGALLRVPSAVAVGDFAQGGDEVVFLNDGADGGLAWLPRKDVAAVWAAERLFAGIPYRIPTTLRAGMFPQGGGNFSHERKATKRAQIIPPSLGQVGVERGPGHAPGAAYLFAFQVTGFQCGNYVRFRHSQ
jgi:hypothetical protein